MKRYYEVLEYQKFTYVTFYTVKFQNDTEYETDKFITRFQNEEYKEDLDTILYWLEKISKRGALKRHFRYENKADAIPTDRCNLRLYCYRLSDEILIIGNGGIKTSKKVKDSPNCYPHFKLMNNVAYLIKKGTNEGSITIKDKRLRGNLKFYINSENYE